MYQGNTFPFICQSRDFQVNSFHSLSEGIYVCFFFELVDILQSYRNIAILRYYGTAKQKRPSGIWTVFFYITQFFLIFLSSKDQSIPE